MARLHYLTALLAALALVSARELHETRIFIRELASPGNHHARSVADDDGHPDVMALAINTDDDQQLTHFLLARNHQAENSFPIVTDDAVIQPGELKSPALYIDSRVGGVFAATTDEDGQRVMEGSFNHEGERYSMSQETEEELAKRGSAGGERAYVLRKVALTSRDMLDDEDEGFFDDHPRFDARVMKSRASGDYHVKIAIYVDYSTYNYWLQKKGSKSAALDAINYKFSYSLAGIQLVYSSILKSRDGFSITPWIVQLYVNTNFNDSPLRDIDRSLTANDPKSQKTSGPAILKSLNTPAKQDWMNSLGMQPGHFVGQNVDVFMLWNSYDMIYSAESDILGRANTNSVCAGHALSTVEDVGFETWMSAAHEVGHVLGSKHDGDSKNADAKRCSNNDAYVMRMNTNIIKASASENHVTFSTCSITQFGKAIDTRIQNNYNCLANAGSNGVTMVPVSPEPGQVYTADDQCHMIFGDSIGEGACTYNNQRADVCNVGLNCYRAGRCKRLYRPADGTPCGGGKKCSRGYCA